MLICSRILQSYCCLLMKVRKLCQISCMLLFTMFEKTTIGFTAVIIPEHLFLVSTLINVLLYEIIKASKVHPFHTLSFQSFHHMFVPLASHIDLLSECCLGLHVNKKKKKTVNNVVLMLV